jgi:hypothetical protein
MKVVPRNKISKLLSKPPVLVQNAIVTGWLPRRDVTNLNALYSRAVLPEVDTLSCIRPVYNISNKFITTLSAGWWTTQFPYFDNTLTFTPDLSHGLRTIVWREVVTNVRGLTANNIIAGTIIGGTTSVRILQYPDKPSFRPGAGQGLFTRYSDQFLAPYNNDGLNQPGTTFRIAFSSLQHTFDRELFANVKDSVLNKPLFPQPLSALWLQNGVPIPNTANTFTYTPTADNCLIQFSISAQNHRGVESYTSPPLYITLSGYRYAANACQEILARTTNQPGGSASMNMFTVKNHNTRTYVRNPNLWCGERDALPDLTEQFTGCVVYKTFSYESYGGVLITPRHVLYCQHAHPQAKGTWPPNLNAQCDLTFVTSNNIPVSCTQLHQASDPRADLAVAVLDRDMEALGLHVTPILDRLHEKTMWATNLESSYRGGVMDFLELTSFATTGLSTPYIAVSQGAGRATNIIPPNPISKYPLYNDIMLHISPQPYTHPLSSFRYNVWDGDSGTPVFLNIDSTVYLTGILTTGSFGFVPADPYTINQLITAADANAIAMGRLSTQTGYTVSSFPLSTIPVPPLFNAVYSLV